MEKSVLVQSLFSKFENKKATVGIVGLGYVGVPLALRLAEVGYAVVGFDRSVDKVRALTSGQRCFSHIEPADIKKWIDIQRLQVFSSPDHLSYCDAIIVCVPTPVTESREPDTSYMEEACWDISRNMRKGQLVVLESTTYPGTTTGLVLDILSQNPNGLEVGNHFFLAYSPEREDPGNELYCLQNTPKVVAGYTSVCLQLATALYKGVVDKLVPVSSLATAEMVKILENTYRAVNIALVNELKVLSHRLDIDIWEVIEAAKTKPFGYQAFYPSSGYGGHCLACDPYYLTYRARQVEIPTKFIELASEVNWDMPRYVAQRVQLALNTAQKSVHGAAILALGVAYKKNIGDLRESSALKVIRDLINLGAKVQYCDPFAEESLIDLQEEGWLTLQSVELSTDLIQAQDCVVLLTDHDRFDYQRIQQHAKLIVDTRHRFDAKAPKVTQA